MARLLVGATLLFAVGAFGATEPWATAIVEALLFSVGAWGVLTDSRQAPDAVNALLTAVLIAVAIAVCQAVAPRAVDGPISSGPWTPSRLATLGALKLGLAYAAFLWACPRLLPQPEDFEGLCWAIFALGVATALVGLAQGDGSVYGLRALRPGRHPFGPFFNRNHASALLTASGLIGLGLFAKRWLSSGRSSPADSIEFAITQAVFAFLLAIIAFAVYRIGSRGGLANLGIGVLALAAAASLHLMGRSKRRAALAFLALCSAGALVLATLAARAFSVPDSSTGYRISMWASSLTLLGDHPWWGTGLGAIYLVFPRYQQAGLHGYIEHVHSNWLELPLQLGIPAAAAILAALGWYAARCFRAWKDHSATPNKALAASCAAALAGFVAHEAVDFGFHTPAVALTVLCLATALPGLLRQSDPDPAPRSSLPKTARLGVAAAMCVTAVSALMPAVADAYAARAPRVVPAARPYLFAKAFSWHERPRYLFELASELQQQADRFPVAKPVLLRQAVAHVMGAARAEPLNEDFRYLLGYSLWNLGRAADARDLLRRPRTG